MTKGFPGLHHSLTSALHLTFLLTKFFLDVFDVTTCLGTVDATETFFRVGVMSLELFRQKWSRLCQVWFASGVSPKRLMGICNGLPRTKLLACLLQSCTRLFRYNTDVRSVRQVNNSDDNTNNNY